LARLSRATAARASSTSPRPDLGDAMLGEFGSTKARNSSEVIAFSSTRLPAGPGRVVAHEEVDLRSGRGPLIFRRLASVLRRVCHRLASKEPCVCSKCDAISLTRLQIQTLENFKSAAQAERGPYGIVPPDIFRSRGVLRAWR
jgi:hypothetical protein